MSELAEGLDQLRLGGSRRLAALRFAGVTGFLCISLLLAFGLGVTDWRPYVPVLAPYALLSGMCWFALRRGGRSRLVRSAMPFADVLVVFLVQQLSLPISPHPAGVAGFSLGLFAFVLVLASLTLTPRLIAWTAALSWVCEAALQQQAGIAPGAVAAAGLVLLLVAFVLIWSTQRLRGLVLRTVAEEVSARLANERSERLEAARRELEEKHTQLLAAQREAEALGNLLVHDLKGPLTTILCYTGLVREQLGESPLADDLRIAEGAGQRMNGMIGDLLAISRLENHRLELVEDEVDVAGLLREIAVASRAAAKQRGIELSVAAPPVLVARFDRELIRRVVENLVGNALRFVQRNGRVELSASARDGALRLSVRNDGPVIPQAVRATLFQRFGAGAERSGLNAGLGLYFCQLAAAAHGGGMSLEDQPGWNVAFVASLPRAQARETA